jgi:DNA-binding NarL/FixJ family response regulator
MEDTPQPAERAGFALARAKPRVLLADEHPIVLEGLRKIAEQAGFHVVDVFREGNALVEAAEMLFPDLIVLDLKLPGLSRTDAARRFRQQNPNIPVLLLGTNQDQRQVDGRQTEEGDKLHGGSSAFISRKAAASELETAMRNMLELRIYAKPLRLETVSEPNTEPYTVLGPRSLHDVNWMCFGSWQTEKKLKK